MHRDFERLTKEIVEKFNQFTMVPASPHEYLAAITELEEKLEDELLSRIDAARDDVRRMEAIDE